MPSVIGLDIIFPENDRTSPKEITSFYKKFFNIDSSIHGLPQSLQDNDLRLSNALKQTASVMSVYLSKSTTPNEKCINLKSLDLNTSDFILENFDSILCNTSTLSTSAPYLGFVNVNVDEDGILRRIPLLRKYKNNILPTLSIATLLSLDSDLKVLSDNRFEILDHTIQTDKQTNILVNFYDDMWYKKVSAIDLLQNKVPTEMLTGKIILVGSSASALHDQIIIRGGRKFIGVQVHVSIIDNILNDSLLVQPESYKNINLLLSLILSFLFLYLLIKKWKKLLLVLFIGIIFLATFLTIIQFENGVYISIGYFLIPFLLHFFILSILYIIIDTYDKHLFAKELTRLHIANLDKKVKLRTADLEIAKNKIEKAQKKINDSIDYASLIQNSILPDENIMQKYFHDSFIFWLPKDTVGGDIYFATELKSQEEIIVMVIDGAGHGVPGAFVTMLVKAIEAQIVAEIANNNLERSPAKILEYFNISIKTMLKQTTESKSNAGFDGGVLYYNKKTEVCRYAGAKTPLYTIHDSKIDTIKSDRSNVGYIRTKIDQKYTDNDITIHENMQLYISTDGIYDQEGFDNKKFSKKAFQELILRNHKSSLLKQKDSIIKSFRMFKSDFEQTDDITVMGLKF
ncbi:MAG: serine phosphatase RsbU (regulator of sigma subunit)/CHASE2 domain-containing sensor protein [Sulfurimonas sp.]|jgi:serine phosphatase RsbU (regulator of sigma subunit)/CHASE2 domain-containing sensor protein